MSDLWDKTICLRPIKAQADYEALVAAAQEDGHVVISPTHAFWKGGEIAGYCCAGWTVHWWLHSGKCDRRDSILAISQMEAVLRDKGQTAYVMLCADNSPYFDLLERLGFTKLGHTVAFERRL